MKDKVIEWLRRYLPAEIFAIIGALIGGIGAHLLFSDPIVTSLAGTWGENAGFYGKIVYADVRARVKKDQKVTFLGMMKVLRNAIVEFGPGEYLDSFIIRPAAMYFFPKLVGNVPLGILIGKFSADITFYIPTIIAYEFRKKVFKD